MNCAAIGELIALYVEGDLPEPQRISVESHLQGCAACRDVTGDLRESQSILKEFRLGAVNAAVLAEVRQRVLEEVGDMQPAPAWVLMMHRLIFAGLRHKTAIAGFALAVLISGGVWFGQTRLTGQRESIAQIEAPSTTAAASLPQRPASVAQIVKRAKPLKTSAVAAPEISTVLLTEEPIPSESSVSESPMKFVTDDPDIIIYWLPTKGDWKQCLLENRFIYIRLVVVPACLSAQSDICSSIPSGGGSTEVVVEQMKERADQQARQEKERSFWTVQMFPVKYLDSADALKALCIFSAEIVPQPALHMVSVRAPKTTLPAIEEAIKRLDVPQTGPKSVEVTVQVLMASDSVETLKPVPPGLKAAGIN